MPASRLASSAAFAVVMLGISSVGTWADEAKIDRTGLFQTMLRRIEQNDNLQSQWRQCPADIYGTQKSLWYGLFPTAKVETAYCRKDPYACYKICAETSNPEGCFELANTLEIDLDASYAKYFEPLYAQACAGGHAGGCTNRAAGIRNGDFAMDPFGKQSAAARSLCTFRSFDLTCATGDPWGCTMLGQAYQYGEGVKADAIRAKDLYQRSCAISPNFAACDYANGKLAELDAGANPGSDPIYDKPAP